MKYLIFTLMDIVNIFILRIKMIFKSLSVIIAFVVSITITVIMINTFLDSSEAKSSIPVGLINSSDSVYADAVVENLYDLKSIYIYEKDFNTLKHMLSTNDVYCIIEINKDFDKCISGNRSKKAMTIYYAKGNKNLNMVSDIVISRIMDEVCYNSCYKAYKTFKDDYNLSDEDEYRKYTEEIYEDYGESFSIDLQIVNLDENMEVTNNISNGIMYRLVIIGIITILISFIILFASNSIIADKTFNTSNRIRISSAGFLAKVTADMLALFFTGELYVVFAYFMFVEKLEIESMKNTLLMFITLSLFCLIISVIFVWLTQIIKESVMLQITGAFIVCVSGMLGAMEIISFTLPDSLKKLSTASPNTYVVRVYDAISVLGDGYKNTKLYLIYTLIMLGIFYATAIARDLYISRISKKTV